MANANSFFDLIPPEINLAIASKLKTSDLCRLIDAIPSLGYLTNENQFFQNVCFFKMFDFKICYLVDIRSDVITSLNISCVYWISSERLRSALIGMKNLTALYAVNTKLSFTEDDCEVYSELPKLVTLALTIASYTAFETTRYPQLIRNLYVHLDLLKDDRLLLKIVQNMHRVEEMWIVDTVNMAYCNCPERLDGLNRDAQYNRGIAIILQTIYMVGPFLTKFTLKLRKQCLPLATLHFPTFCLTYDFMDCKRYEKSKGIDGLGKLFSTNSLIWTSIYHSCNHTWPFGYNDLRNIARQGYNLEKLYLQELNLEASCIPKHCDLTTFPTDEIIHNNLRFLKKLSIRNCFCDTKFEQIINQCPLIETLEVSFCNIHSLVNISLKPVSNMQTLTHLTLTDVIISRNDTSLLEICEKCTRLTSLKIKDLSPLCSISVILEAIKLTQGLVDFQLEVGCRISFDFLDALGSLPGKTVRRMSITCLGVNGAVRWSRVGDFLLENQQVVFFYLNVKTCSDHFTKHVANLFNFYKTGPAKCYLFTNLANVNEIDVPFVHKKEMIWWQTDVATVDVFNGFCQ